MILQFSCTAANVDISELDSLLLHVIMFEALFSLALAHILPNKGGYGHRSGAAVLGCHLLVRPREWDRGTSCLTRLLGGVGEVSTGVLNIIRHLSAMVAIFARSLKTYL